MPRKNSPMPDHDDRPEPEPEVHAPATEPASAPFVEWREYKLRKARVSVTAVNGKALRVQELGDGFHSVEVEGLEPLVTEEPIAVCLAIAEKSAWTGRLVRRVVSTSGEDSYQ